MSGNSKLVEFYEQLYAERDRLGRREGALEFVRTQELLGRFLPPPPAKIVDIGGGTGIYASWLTSLGYEVHLVEMVPAHVEAALQMGAFSAVVGDARSLPDADGTYDVALLFGPLYHLLELEDRLQALCEASRVVRANGLVVAAFISRGAVVLDGFVKGWIDKPGIVNTVRDHVDHGSSSLATGFGQISYFHFPSEARAEVAAAGLEVIELFGVEGPSWIAHDFDDRWLREEGRNVILESAQLCETELELQVLSPHLLAFSRPASTPR